MDITALSVIEVNKLISDRKLSAVDLVKAQLEMIKQREASYHCYITILEEDALEQAKEVQKRIDSGELKDTLLAGIPMAVKDNICTKGVKTTCASKMLSNFTPTYDATVIEKLKNAGAILLGKTNMDEFAMGSTSETSYYGATKNPWNVDHVSGGSSGGSAAVVAAQEAYFALGTDTGGSIRQPSAYCGVTGLKPTYGTVSRYGLITYASSLDQIGPIGRSIGDCAAVMEAISGHDPKDSTSIDRKNIRYLQALKEDIKGMRIGIPKAYLERGLQKEVKDSILNTIKILTEKGAIVEEFDLGIMDQAVPAYYVIASAEASSNLSRFDGVKYGYRTPNFESLQDLYKKSRSEGFGTEVKRRLMIGAFALSSGNYEEYYKKALKIRSLIYQIFQKAFEKYDLILSPVSSRTAPKFGESLSDPLKMYSSDIYTVSVNLAGLPAVSLPCGRDKNGLPIGVQLIGKHFGEEDLIRAAHRLEQAIGDLRYTTHGKEA
ncbi:MAG: Asp-tRNA(Asn)/Glu-tRNA(Gln) amidotransferase subunit GatA [Clostridiales bacterium]|nr:Asp-tRNA(Asn)/Glu-tRNA(Gln) amidotransferase subunit GatA [Clostridiales bacterium]